RWWPSCCRTKPRSSRVATTSWMAGTPRSDAVALLARAGAKAEIRGNPTPRVSDGSSCLPSAWLARLGGRCCGAISHPRGVVVWTGGHALVADSDQGRRRRRSVLGDDSRLLRSAD